MEVFPLGLPDLTLTQSQLVEMGNQLVSVSVKLCFALYIAGGYFSLENPERSLLWIHPDVLELFRLSVQISVPLLRQDGCVSVHTDRAASPPP